MCWRLDDGGVHTGLFLDWEAAPSAGGVELPHVGMFAVDVQTAAEFAQVAAQRCPNIAIKEVTPGDIESFTETQELEAKWEHVPTLHGTQGVHHLEVVSWGVIKMCV